MDETHNADTIIRPRGDRRPGGADPAVGVNLDGSADASGSATHRSVLEADTVVRESGVVESMRPGSSPAPSRELPITTTVHRLRVSINGSEPLTLDVPHFVGRNPRLPRVIAGTTPRLVTVPSSRGEVSGTHLELSQVGASIVVTDLRSTNGTMVTMPGAMPLMMRSGESLVAVPGTIVEIGDGNSIEILSPPRLQPSDITPTEQVL